MSDPLEMKISNTSQPIDSMRIRYVTRNPDEARLLEGLMDAANEAAAYEPRAESGLSEAAQRFRIFARRLRKMAEE